MTMTLRTILIALVLAACGTSSQPTKNSSAKGSGAKAAGQKAGGTAESNKSMATSDGAEYEDVTCDDSEEGVAWCDSDTTVIFCTGGTWYALDCSAVGGDFCAELDDTVDCYAIE
jgi:hypothetical protein